MKRSIDWTIRAVWRRIVFHNEDIRIMLNAWEHAEDCVRETGFADFEYEGEVHSEEYTDILEALKTFVELMNKGWEVVELDIRPKEMQNDANFAIYIRNSYKRGISVIVSINETEINNKLARKLAKIEEIIKEDA